MSRIHPTAIVEGEVNLADGVEVGPYCILRGPITIGEGTVLIQSVHLQGPLTMGAQNICYPTVCLGFAPQHAAYDPSKPGAGLVIGDKNTFREAVSIHRAFTASPTRIGHRNLFMNNTHAGHDTQLGNDCTIAGGAMLAGHCEIGDRVLIGGLGGVHQFVRIGRGAMISGLAAATKDVLPFLTVTSLNVAGSVNVIGMRRMGLTPTQIDTVKWIWSVLCRRKLTIPHAISIVEERQDDPIVAEMLAFAKGSKRGICTMRRNELRG
ncbi:MAG: acyl-ACP--UDP-N-acetylglucosamine O-acyltransferase [Planctomycetota bacterium]|nr:acyl-ACP--UDP-N-acetylglucosamine O-acyltransferase [Planctomycetota bacterium]